MQIIKPLREKGILLSDEIETLEIKTKEMQRLLSLKKIELQKTEEQIKHLENGDIDIPISDHCLLRYIERIEEFDFSAIKSDLVTSKIKKEYIENGDGKYFNETLNCFVCIKGGTVTTLHFGDYDIKEEVEL